MILKIRNLSTFRTYLMYMKRVLSLDNKENIQKLFNVLKIS